MMSLTSSLANAETRGPYVFRTLSQLIPVASDCDSGSGNGGDIFPDRIDKRLHIRHVCHVQHLQWICAAATGSVGTGMTTSPTLTCVDGNVHVEQVLAFLRSRRGEAPLHGQAALDQRDGRVPFNLTVLRSTGSRPDHRRSTCMPPLFLRLHDLDPDIVGTDDERDLHVLAGSVRQWAWLGLKRDALLLHFGCPPRRGRRRRSR